MSTKGIAEELQRVVAAETAQSGVGTLAPTLPFENFETAEDAGQLPFGKVTARGRPLNSPNKRTLAMREYFLARYTHPLQFLGEIYSRPTKDLAQILGCELVEALDIQRKAATDALPYLESKMPTQLKLPDDDGVPMLVVGSIAAEAKAIHAGRAAGTMSIDDDVIEAIDLAEQNQRLSGEPGE